MPATTVAALLDYETNYENALAGYLDNVNALSSVQVLTPRTLLTTDPVLTTPRITVSMSLSGTNPNQQATRSNTSAVYDSHKIGNLTLNCTIRRDGSGQSLTTVRGGVREAMLSASAALNSNNLPYYQTVTVREESSTFGPGTENDEIQCQLSYLVEFYIKPDQWPAS
jgi:hypothetical protein